MSRACPCSPLARGTRGAADVSERLTTAPLGSHAVDTGDGHVWVRLQPPLGIPIADVVASLVGDVRRLNAIALGLPSRGRHFAVRGAEVRRCG